MLSGQHIGFKIGNEEFAIPILSVQEIIKPVQATKIPEAPEYILGVINMRNRVIPVIDLKKKMYFSSDSGVDHDQKIVLVNVGSLTVGGLVDGITGVVNVRDEDVERNISALSGTSGEYIQGIVTMGEDKLLQLLDFSKLLTLDDMMFIEGQGLSGKSSTDGSAAVTENTCKPSSDFLVKEVRDEIISRAESKGLERNMVQQIMTKVQQFLDSLSNGDLEGAEGILVEISAMGEKELFTEIGKITRNLHNALGEFKTMIDPRLKNIALEEMPNAADKLHWVITKTEEAAGKTIGLIEKNLILQSDIIKRLDVIDERLKELDGAAQAEKEAVRFLRNAIEEMNADFMEVLLAQEFQDLTGQIIKKVISLVAELESQLVQLVKVFGVKVEPKKKEEWLSGPQTSDSGTEETVAKQEDVDSLLKDFGF